MTGGRRAVFLDRDGVINRAVVRDGRPYPPATLAELEIPPDTAAALAGLKRSGFLLLVVTNQPDVGRGAQQRAVVDSIHDRLKESLPLDDVFVCCHTDDDRCDCRKPAPGLIFRAAERYGIDVAASFLIGDRWRDIEAGESAGCRTVLIDYGYRERPPSAGPAVRVRSLRAAVNWIVAQSPKERAVTESLTDLRVKLYADGADMGDILALYANPLIRGFTTNPTLMRRAGVGDYATFAHGVLAAIPDRPISFEVFADEFPEMERQAHRIAGWSDNVYVKIPITNSQGESSLELIRRLSLSGVKVNVTALLDLDQVYEAAGALSGGAAAYVSVFAGRIADTGRDPVPLMAEAVDALRPHPQVELIWASPRELLNVFHADSAGCHIITVTSDVLRKLSLVGKDLRGYSLETVRMFRDDALQAGYRL
jgi:transaldolase